MARAIVLALVGALALGASSALGLVLVPTFRPLPGSNFQGGDGNQTNGRHHLIDWEYLEDQGLVGHQPDLGPGPPHNSCSGNPPTGPGCDDHFTAPGAAASKELKPGGWTLTAKGSVGVPADDILDVYHTFTRRNGQAFLYLAMTRLDNRGTTFLALELNQVAEPAFFSNGFAVPCRTTGDLLITFTQHGSGSSVSTEVGVREWKTETEQANGCAATGTEEIVTNERFPAGSFQGAFNADAIHNFLPGCGRPGCFKPDDEIPPRQFMEAAINLTKVLHFENEPCNESEFLSVWAHSRASDTESSDMEDYVAPKTVVEDVCPARPTLTTQPHADVDGMDTTDTTVPHGAAIWDQADLHGGNAPTGDLVFHLYGPNDTDCSKGAIFTDTVPVTGAGGPWNSGSPTGPLAPGTYEWTVTYDAKGDPNNVGTTTRCGAEPVTISPAEEPPPQPPPPSPAHPSLTTSASPTTAPYRSAVGDTATLAGGDDPTGTITWRLYGPNDGSCSEPPAFVLRQNVDGNGSYSSPTPSPTLSGTYRWVAEYSGDAHNAGVSTSCGESGETVVVESPFPIRPSPEEPEQVQRPRPKPPPPKFTG